MIWNCNGEIRKIEFVYVSALREYSCKVNRRICVWETSYHTGLWDWFREGYTEEYAKWRK